MSFVPWRARGRAAQQSVCFLSNVSSAFDLLRPRLQHKARHLFAGSNGGASRRSLATAAPRGVGSARVGTGNTKAKCKHVRVRLAQQLAESQTRWQFSKARSHDLQQFQHAGGRRSSMVSCRPLSGQAADDPQRSRRQANGSQMQSSCSACRGPVTWSAGRTASTWPNARSSDEPGVFEGESVELAKAAVAGQYRRRGRIFCRRSEETGDAEPIVPSWTSSRDVSPSSPAAAGVMVDRRATDAMIGSRQTASVRSRGGGLACYRLIGQNHSLPVCSVPVA